MKKSLLLVTVLGLALAVLLTKVEKLSWSVESDNKLLTPISIQNPTSSSRSDGLYVTVEKDNTASNPVTSSGMNITNQVNASNSNLANGEVAIDIILDNPSNAKAMTGIGVTITFDDFIYNNFDITVLSATNESTPSYNSSSHKIEWILKSVPNGTRYTLTYKLKVKSNANTSLINGKTLRTSRQITVVETGITLGTYPRNDQLANDAIICSPGIKIRKSVDCQGHLTVAKVVLGKETDSNEKFNFTVTLSDTSVNGTYGEMTFTNGVAKFTLTNGERKTASNLTAGITYTVTEEEANKNDYTTSSSNASGTIPTDDTIIAIFNNKYNNPVGNLIVAKKVKGENADTNKEFNFKVTLSDTSISGSYTDMYFTNGVATFKLKHNETKTARNLPSGITYTVEETDANQDHYTASSDNASNTIKTDYTQVATFTNAYGQPRGNLSITKTVVGNQPNANKTFNIKLTLSDKTILGKYGDIYFAFGVSNFTLKHNETKVVTDLPAGITYSVVETDANENDYTFSSSTGTTGTIAENDTKIVTLTNTYHKAAGDLTVKKTTTGGGADTNQQFNFKVTLGNTSINGDYGAMKFIKGVATFTLKHNESITANNLPAGTTYTVEETDANKDNYVTTYTNENNSKSAQKVTGTIKDSQTSTVTVNNNREIKKSIMINKEFDTTTNYNTDVTINYSTFTANGTLSEEEYKTHIANQKLTVMASVNDKHTSFTVTADKDGNIKIPATYANTYTDYKISKNIDDGSISLSFTITKETPEIPNTLDFTIKVGSNWTQEVTLKSSENWTKTYEIDFNVEASTNIEVTEKNHNDKWNFTYTTNTTNGNCTIFLVNKGGEYKMAGTIEKKEVKLTDITIEKSWNILDNYIDIYYSNKNNESFAVEVKLLDKDSKVLETVKLDETGHGTTKNKYSKNKELYVEYPNGEKVKVNTYKEIIPNNIEVKINDNTYVLSEENNWLMTITGEFDNEPSVEEVKVDGYTTETPKITKEGDNYKVSITNTQLSNRNANYDEPEKPVENPKTGIKTYVTVGVVIIITSLIGLYFLKRKNVL